MSLPNCCYDYRYEGKKRKVIGVCDECGYNIYEGDLHYNLKGTLCCEECMEEFKVEE